MSASTTPTEWPCWASATARLVVTLDLPTPPLPDEISSGRVFEPVCANGISRPSAWPCAWLWPALAPASPCSVLRRSSRSSSVITVNSRSIESTPSSSVDGLGHALGDLVAQRAAGDGERDEDADDAVAVGSAAAQHAEVDDRTVQLGVLDRSQGFDDLGFGDGGGHGRPVWRRHVRDLHYAR